MKKFVLALSLLLAFGGSFSQAYAEDAKSGIVLKSESYDARFHTIYRLYHINQTDQDVTVNIPIPPQIAQRVEGRPDTLLEAKKELYSAYLIFGDKVKIDELDNKSVFEIADNSSVSIDSSISDQFQQDRAQALLYATNEQAKWSKMSDNEKISLYDNSNGQYNDYPISKKVVETPKINIKDPQEAKNMMSGETTKSYNGSNGGSVSYWIYPIAAVFFLGIIIVTIAIIRKRR